MRPSFEAFMNEMSKTALIERLVRLAATPIKGTPKLFMKNRTPQELAQLQNTVEQGWNKRVTDPIMRVAEKGISKLPQKTQGTTRVLTKMVAEDPVFMGAAKALPIPGASFAYLAGKKGLERVIDKVAPLTG